MRKTVGVSYNLYGWFFLISLFVIWEIFAKQANLISLPPPSKIATSFIDIALHNDWQDVSLFSHITSSLRRFLIGYGASVVLMCPLGILIGKYSNVYFLTHPTIDILRTLPAIVLYPILIIIFGFGEEFKYLLIFISCAFPIIINTADGVRGIKRTLLDTGLVYGLSEKEILLKITIPAASPYIFSGCRVALGIGFILTIIAEMLHSGEGIGHLIFYSARQGHFNTMYVGIVLGMIVGNLLNYLFENIEKFVMKWQLLKGG